MGRYVAIFLFLCLVAPISRAERVSFLRVRLVEGKLEVLEHRAVPGTLKRQPDLGPIMFQIGTGDPGGDHFRARLVLPDRLEYPEENGEIGSIPVNQAEFTIRAPFQKGATLRILRRRSPAESGPNALSTAEIVAEAEVPPPSERLHTQAAPPSKLATLLINGPSSNRLNIVVFGDGFQAHEESTFTNRAAALLTRFLGMLPYSSFSKYFNGYSIFVPSDESGSDIPSKGIARDTYFNSTFESFGIDRLLTIPPNNFNSNYQEGRGRVFNLLAEQMPDYDIVAMLVNDSTYGGSGGVPAIASVNNSSAEIAIHELGHSFAGLGDEYESPANYPDIEEPNTTRETRREFLKWRSWVLESTPVPTPETEQFASAVGLFEGAHYHSSGWYRPKLNCMMRTLGVPFCEVCSEALVLGCYSRVDMLESVSPEWRIVTSTAESPARLEFTRLPGSRTIGFAWRANGVLLGGGESFDFGQIFAPFGTSQVMVHAEEQTPFVRNDARGDLVESATWIVTVASSPAPVITGSAGGGTIRFDSSLLAMLVIEGTQDFAGWIPLSTNLTKTVEIPVSQAIRFYRARALPAF